MKLKEIISSIRENAVEIYATALISIGLPVVGLVYVDWRLALAIFVITQTAIAVYALRKSK